MNSIYEIFKTPSGPSTGKALLNHTIFSPSQTGETVPLILQRRIEMCNLEPLETFKEDNISANFYTSEQFDHRWAPISAFMSAISDIRHRHLLF
jgi:hypothetical protein